eukprot:gene5097-8696_t
MEEDEQTLKNDSNFKVIFLIVLLFNIFLFCFITFPKITKLRSLEEKECEVVKTNIFEDICKSRECIGKGRKAKCKDIKYPCFFSNVTVKFNLNHELQTQNIINKIPKKKKYEVMEELKNYEIYSKFICFYDKNEKQIEFSKPNLFENFTFSFVFLILSFIALFIVYLQSRKEYRFKEPGLSNKMNTKLINQCKRVTFHFDTDHFDTCSTMNSERTVFKNLKVDLVDGHTDVLEYWLNNFKYLGDKKYTIVHIDSRFIDPDIDIPNSIQKSDYLKLPFDHLVEKYQLDIANFMMPMVYLNKVNRIIWINNDLNLYDKFHIGKVKTIKREKKNKNEREIKCNSTSALLEDEYKIQHNEVFIDSKEIELICVTLDKLKDLKLNSKQVLLDIDFDFFSTLNPELHPLSIRVSGMETSRSLISPLNLLNYCYKKNIHKFNERQIEEFKYLKKNNDEISFFGKIVEKYLVSCLRNENEQIFEDCSKISRMFWCNDEEDGRKKQIQFHYFLINLFELEDRNEILQTCIMTANLPYFIDSEFKIRKKMKMLKNVLNQMGLSSSSPPKLISLCKSELDGHTPKFLIDFLKNEIFEMLNELFIKK